jgi:hypothetical protein
MTLTPKGHRDTIWQMTSEITQDLFGRAGKHPFVFQAARRTGPIGVCFGSGTDCP